MWQHAANIIVGLILIAVSLFCALGHSYGPLLIWCYLGAGAAVTLFGCWGLYDELEHEQDQPARGGQ